MISRSGLLPALLLLLACSSAPGQQRSPTNSQTNQVDAEDLVHLIDISDMAARMGQFEDAIEGFEAVLARDKADTSPELRARAAMGLVLARGEMRKQRNGVWGAVSRFPAPYLIFILVPLTLFLLFRLLVRIFPGPGTTVSFSDLNAGADSASASSRSLTADVLNLLEDPEPVTVAGLQMNTMPGTGQPAFGVVRPAQAMTPAQGFTPSETPIRLAGVEFSLRDLTQFVGRLFARPSSETLVGWLHCRDQYAIAEAELTRLHTQRGSRRKRISWRTVATGVDARRTAIANIAAQILVDMRESRFTDNWQSLKACQEGIRAMRQKDGHSALHGSGSEVRRNFELALMHDPANWIARFYLALALCDEGEPAIALRHLHILDDVLSHAVRDRAFRTLLEERKLTGGGVQKRRTVADTLSRMSSYFRAGGDRSARRSPRVISILEHLVDYPECPFIIQYNIALALDELHHSSGDQDEFLSRGAGDVVWGEPLKSLEMIGAFWPKETLRGDTVRLPNKYELCERLLGDRDRFELSLYAQSARAHILSMRDATENVTDLNNILTAINATCGHARRLDRSIDNWKALQTTRAVALAALARALAPADELSANKTARDLLYQAIAAEPTLVDAHLQLAKLYMRRRQSFARDWIAQAESLMKRALELNPTCEETKKTLAALYAMPSVGRVAEAVEILRSLPQPHRANLDLAKLVIDQGSEDSDYVDALMCLKEHSRISWAFTPESAECYNRVIQQCQSTSTEGRQAHTALQDLLRQISADVSVPDDDKLRINRVLDVGLTSFTGGANA